MGSALLLVGVLAGCGLLLWISYKIEPHWVSRDGTRMICYGQVMSRNGQASGRWRELRVSKVHDDTVEVRTRRGSLAVDRPSAVNPMRLGSSMGAGGHSRRASYWKVAGKAETTLKNRVLYMLDGNTDVNMPEMLAIRLPLKSKAIPMLEAMSLRRSASVPRPSRETTRAADQPDPG